MQNLRRFVCVVGTMLAAPTLAQTSDKPQRNVSDPGVATTRRAFTSAGVQSVFDGRVHAAAPNVVTAWYMIKGWNTPYPKPFTAVFSPMKFEYEEDSDDD